jgi:hypothetical protein
MSLINVNLALLAYADAPASATPSLRLADLKWSMMGMPTDNFKNCPVTLAPGETVTIASTARTLDFDSSTTFEVSSPYEGCLRLAGNFGQRTSRSSGDETTEWALTKKGDLIRATYSGTGTSPDFSSFSLGDGITLDAPFQTYNRGDFTVVSKGSNYVEFINALAQPETLVGQVRVYSSGPVQKGDILDLSSGQFNYLNQISAAITRVNDQFVEVACPMTIEETVTGVTDGLYIYPNAFKWLFIAVDRKAIVGLNGEAPTNNEIEPFVEGDLVKNPGLFMKRGKVFEVQLRNPGLQTVQGLVILAE